MKAKYSFGMAIPGDSLSVFDSSGALIGIIRFFPAKCKFGFKPLYFKTFDFFGDTRNDAVENYYKFYGGKN